MDKWSVDEVYTWLLDVVGVPESTAALFKENEIDGHVLSMLKEDELKNEFNTSFGQRKKIQMLRDDTMNKGRYWTIWVVPPKGVKVGVRNVDPDKDIEELKSKIRDHPELNLTGFMLSEFSLHRKGGIDLPVGGVVKDCLAPGDEVDVLSHRADNTAKAALPNPYGTNMYKPHYRPPALPGSPRERSPSDPGEDVLVPSALRTPKREESIPLVNSLALSFNTNASQRHSFSGASSSANLRSSNNRLYNPNNSIPPTSPPIRSAMIPRSPNLVSITSSSSPVTVSNDSTSSNNQVSRVGSNLRISTANASSPTIPESPGVTPDSPLTNNALHGHQYLYNSTSSLPSPGATSMASSWENITNPGSSRSSSPTSPKIASPLLLPNIPRSPSSSGRSSPSLSGSYGISHSSNEMMANAIVDYNMFMGGNNSSGAVRSTSGRRWSTIASPSPPLLTSSDDPPAAYSYKRRSSVPTPPTLPPRMSRTESMSSIMESSEPSSPAGEAEDTDHEDFDDADVGLDHEDDTIRPSHPFYVVGIGASAGGLEALEQFFDNMANNSGMAFVVVQHLSPNYKSMMVQLLGKHTNMIIKKVEDRMKIEPNHIYLLQPSMNIFIEHGLLRVHKQDRSGRAVNLPINLFFKSLGLYFREKTIGIILSGTGSDGMDGIRCIKEQSGMVMVQNNSAKFDGMPQSAINTGLVDYILSPEQMPAELLRYARFPATVGSIPSDPLISFTQMILDIVYKQTAINFTNYKKATIWRRIEHRMNVNRYDDIEVYIKFLETNHEEVTLLAKDLLIGVTKFFRDHEVWEGMKKRVIPAIVQNSKSGAVRVWVVACSTGEEAYTLAILFQEYKEQSKLEFEIKIYATDIDRDAVERAGTGYYEEGSLVASLSIERIQKFFVKRGNGYVVTPQLRRMVIFAVQNVISDPPFNKMDLITCRNLLIYFEHQQQKEVLSLFHYSLIPGGFLVLGKSESNLSSSSRFEQFDQKWRIFRNKGGFASWNVENFKPKKYLNNIDSQKKVIAAIAGEAKNVGDSDGVLQQLCHVWVDEYIPPCFVVDAQGNLHHTFGEVMPFMRISGKATLNILKIVKKELSISLGIAIRRAAKEKRAILYKEVHLRELDTFVHVRVFPLPATDPELLAIFIEKSLQQIHSFKPSDASDHEVVMLKTRLADLEQELEQTKENLQVTVEELETSNEELQSSNEELLAANEELQSTNEELQSVNEELYTVNSENRSKIEELTELNNDMNNLLASTHIGTLFLDRNLNIRKFTTAVSKHIPVMDSDIGRPVKHLSNNSYDFLTEDARIVMQNLTPLEREVCGSDNEWYLMRTLPYHTDHNNVGGVVITFFNISQRKQVEQDLRRAKELAEQAVTAKADFLANMSHEIRTPMNSVKGFAELLVSTPLNDEQRQFVNHIHHSGTIMLTLLNDILDFSSLEVGKLVLHPAPCDLVKIAYDVMDVLSLVARDKKLDLVMKVAPELPIVIGDEKRIRQVLLNLMGNAVKFTSSGHVILRIDFTMDGTIPVLQSSAEIDSDVESIDVSARYIRLEFAVEDTGQGIPSDKLNLIFEKFTQLDSSLSRKHDGSGLGLAISRHLLDLMGSTLNVSSEVGHGSTFWFALSVPLAPESTEEKPREPIIEGLKTLLLENSVAHREVIGTYLKYLKCETVMHETEDELYRFLQHYLQLPVEHAHVFGNQRELAQTLPRSASAQSVVPHHLRRDTLARKGSVDSSLINPIVALVSIKAIKNLSTFRIKLRHIADGAKVQIQTLLLLEAGDLVHLNAYNNVGFSQYIVKPFHAGKLKSQLMKLIDDIPQTLSPVLRAQNMDNTNYLGDSKELSMIKGMRVLVTEDNQVNQLVAEKMLKRLGCEVVIAKDGYEALEKLQTHPVDLVFMDLHMPGLDGYETTRRIRDEELRKGTQRVPIIALTAKSMSSDRQVCLEANMDDYISKPHSLIDLKRVLLLFSPNRPPTLTNSPALLLDSPDLLPVLSRGSTKSAPPRTTSPLAMTATIAPAHEFLSPPSVSSSSPSTHRRTSSPPGSPPKNPLLNPLLNPILKSLTISPPLSVSPPIMLPQSKSTLANSPMLDSSAASLLFGTSPASTALSSTSASTNATSSSSSSSTSDPTTRSDTPPPYQRTTISLPRPSHARNHSGSTAAPTVPFALPPRQTSPTPNELRDVAEMPALSLSPSGKTRREPTPRETRERETETATEETEETEEIEETEETEETETPIESLAGTPTGTPRKTPRQTSREKERERERERARERDDENTPPTTSTMADLLSQIEDEDQQQENYSPDDTT